MELLDLPKEIFIVLIKYLDLQTLQNLYNTSLDLRHVVCLAKTWNMSMNMMATIQTLRLTYFGDISCTLRVLNMCGVSDLCSINLMTALKMLTSLKTLDVSYTRVHILELVPIPEICPTLKDITVDFEFGKTALSSDDMTLCQNLLQHFENIHFIGSQFRLIRLKLALYLLKNTQLRSLKYSINNIFGHVSYSHFQWNQLPQFDNFFIYFVNRIEIYKLSSNYKHTIDNTIVSSVIDLKKYEIIIMEPSDLNLEFYSSPLFDNFFMKQFNVKTKYIMEFKAFTNNTSIMVWNKATTKFDANFFSKLSNHIIKIFPREFQWPCVNPVPRKYNWLFTNVEDIGDSVSKDENDSCITNKKKRTVPSNLLLDYSDMLKDRLSVELSLVFKNSISIPITLSSESEYLKKLTYLSLLGRDSAHYEFSKDFFNTLFQCCLNLLTLNIETLNRSCPIVPSVSQTCHLSKSLRNIRLIEHAVDFVPLFQSFSQCVSLESIYIVDINDNNENNLADPTAMISNCKYLYSINIRASMSVRCLRKRQRAFNEAKKVYKKPYLNVHVEQISPLLKYNPFMEVFRVNAIRPI